MEFLLLLLSALVVGAVGGLLVLSMQHVRYATPSSDVRALRVTLRVFGALLLVVYGVPALLFSVYLLVEVVEFGIDRILNEHSEAIAVLSVAAAVFGTLGASLLLVSIGLTRLERDGHSLRTNPFALLLQGIGCLLVAAAFVLLTTTTLIGGILLVMGIVRYAFSRQEEQRGQVLWTLALAAEGRRSLADELRECALDQGRLFAGQVRYAAELLDTGYSLSAALEAVPGVVSPSSMLMIRMGEEAGDLSGALREAAVSFTRGARRRLGQDQEAIGLRTGIVLGALTVSAVMTSFLMIFIIPKYKRIFSDFNVELPVVTHLLLDFNDLLVRSFPLWIVPFAASTGLVLYGSWMVLSSIDSSRAIEWWAWGWVRPRVATGPLLRCLAIILRAGRPLPGALETLATSFPCRPLQPRLTYVAGEVTRGESVWFALQRTGLLRAEEVELLYAADRAGHLPWAIEELADGLERRAAYRLLTVLEIAQPALVVAAGIVVLWIDAAFFLPLVKLIGDLA